VHCSHKPVSLQRENNAAVFDDIHVDTCMLLRVLPELAVVAVAARVALAAAAASNRACHFFPKKCATSVPTSNAVLILN
jgi:hypothetical protein